MVSDQRVGGDDKLGYSVDLKALARLPGRPALIFSYRLNS